MVGKEEGGRYLQDGGSPSLEESVHSSVVPNIPDGRGSSEFPSSSSLAL